MKVNSGEPDTPHPCLTDARINEPYTVRRGHTTLSADVEEEYTRVATSDEAWQMAVIVANGSHNMSATVYFPLTH